jgi:hypothetical protein
VGSYTITFTPDDTSNASAVVRVDLGANGARITELTVRAGQGDGLVPGELPGFDLGRLMRAIAPAGPGAPAFELAGPPQPAVAALDAYAPVEQPGAPAEGLPADRTATTRAATTRSAAARPGGRGAGSRTASGRTASGRTASGRTASGRAGSGRTTSGRAATGAAKKATAKKTTAKSTTAGTAAGRTAAGRTAAGRTAAGRTAAAGARSRKATAGAGATGTGTSGTGRAYRRAPDDIVAVFTQAPSATALARHYGVPRHTVQGWLRRLRNEGLIPPSSRS